MPTSPWSVHRLLSALVILTLFLTTPTFAERPTAGEPSTAAERQAAWERHLELDEASLFHGLEWRNIGPVVQGGRVVDIESVPGEPYTFYVAYASGGLWKTTNNGVTFEPLFDDQSTLIMGDIAVDPQNPQTIWVGTGENNSSRSSYGGMGVFRSNDGGETWEAMGLEDSDRTGRILVDPRDSNRVYVAVLGKLYTPGGQRGVYRTTDGGETWEEVLAGDADAYTGVIDLVLDPSNPDILYASTWQRSRTPWNFVEGGEGSGIYKTTDGGDTWTRLDGGFPRGEHVGRIGLAISPSNPQILYASLDNQEPLPEEQWDLGDSALSAKRMRGMTEAEFLAHGKATIEGFIRSNDLDTSLDAKKLIRMMKDGEVTVQDLLDEISDANANLFETDIRGLEIYRTDDGGETWRLTHDEPIRNVVYTYGYYFGEVRVAPDNPDRVYAVGVPIIRSDDGGKTWKGIDGRGVHVDYHAGWIDPHYPDRVWIGNDGGVDVSYDGGDTWVKVDSQPVGQFYTVQVDNEDPYNVYGGLQDNGTLKGSSQARPGIDEWRFVGGGDGMHIEVDPRDGTLYTGFQFGFYFRSGGGSVRPRDALKEPALRYNWQTPIRLSDHNADVLYFGAQKLYRSLDRGDTWTALSEDLTTSENRGDVPFATITTLSESPERFGLLWVGTDDGHVWVTDDGGVEWSHVAAGLPADRWVSRVVASHHAEKRAYVSLNGYRQDDITPYLYATDDLGKTWTSIAAGLPGEPINVVREDPVNEDVLYVGTDRGVYVSLDRGKTWQGLDGTMPNVPVHDLAVHPRERELVAGTHGRSVYILDVLPVQELAGVQDDAVHVFPVEDVQYRRYWQGKRSQWFYDPEFDPKMTIPFWSAEDGRATLTVRDGDDRALRTLEQDVRRGVNVITWDLLLDETQAIEAEQQANAGDDADADDKKSKKKRRKKSEESEEVKGPGEGSLAKTPRAEAVRLGWPLYVTPGSYSLEVSVGEASHSTDFEVKAAEPPRPRMKPEPKIRGQKDDE